VRCTKHPAPTDPTPSIHKPYMGLTHLAHTLKQSLGILHKQDIQSIARFLATENAKSEILLGDDCAAIPDGDGYLLLSAEGMMPDFLAADPWFAGWSAVMVNISDIYAMGGRPIAVVDTIWSQSAGISEPLLAGMSAAARAYQVPIVGGHTNAHSPYNALSVAILGRARNLISSFQAQPGDRLLMAIDLRGQMHPQYPFWNAATTAEPDRLRGDLELLPKLAENSLCHAGKDISMGGIVGTTLMLLETSKCGAILNLDTVPIPPELALERWLVSFPSYGFLLSIHADRVSAVQQMFVDRQIACADIGAVIEIPQLILKYKSQSTVFWDFDRESLTGFGNAA
jgi:uncharacterized protein